MVDRGPASVGCIGVIPASAILGEDEEETRLLLELYDRAKNYLTRFSWCSSIEDAYFGVGIGGIIAVFLFRISSTRPEVDKWHWVIVGDIPSAYLVVLDGAKNPIDALRAYIEEMSKWVDAARNGRSVKNIIPVNVLATPEWAERLDSRLRALTEEIVPILSNE